VRVAGQFFDVTFQPAAGTEEAAMEAAYETQYAGSSAVQTMQGAGPKPAAVRITPR